MILPDLPPKLDKILVCPLCHGQLRTADEKLLCITCGQEYPVAGNSPVMLSANHPLLPVFREGLPPPPPVSWKGKLRQLVPEPEPRVWTHTSQQTIARALSEARPDDPDRTVVNLGAGVERVFQRLFAPYHQILYIGLPHSGHVDAFADAQLLPLMDDSVDLFFSSSVLEHIRNPEQAVAEMARVVRPDGLVYAEIPFLRAFHMVPNDFQRYTYSGIEALFERHGFSLVEKGICSGPFNAWGLLFRDFVFVVTPTRPLKMTLRALTSWLIHPFKYLDHFFENATWATYQACNFYYLGRKNR
jgi:SAM-dependent methyltransferase/uncharacterized protein YbaR (Trm112 family)